ncbi:MAG: DinB family protein [Bacteroidota bacterium]
MIESNKAIAERFGRTTEELLQLISKFTDTGFNRKPTEDKWSAAEVAEHLLIFDTRLNKILETTTEATERAIEEKVATIAARVSNRNNKIDAPPFLLPSPGSKSVADLVEKIRAERLLIVKAIEEKDLALYSKEFPHRLFGELTAYEWINLVDTHARRHMEQLLELLAAN